MSHGGKGSKRRPESEPGAYGDGYERIFGKREPERQRVEIICPEDYAAAMRAYEAATAYSNLWGKGWDTDPGWPNRLPAYKAQNGGTEHHGEVGDEGERD